MKRKLFKKSKIIGSVMLALLMLTFPINAFALTEGSYASNLFYNGSSSFMIDGTLYTCSQTKYTYRLEYNKINNICYNLDTCSLIKKSEGGTARGFKVCATTGKGSGTLSIYRNNPYNSAVNSALYTGSGDIVCTVNPNAGFPLGTKTNRVSGSNSYCEVNAAYTYNGRVITNGTVKCYKPNCSGTVTTKVDLY